MSPKTLSLTEPIYNYLLAVSSREPEVLQQLRQETAEHPLARMQIAPEQGQFMALLVQLMSAKKILEIGTFTGYSALWMATALPPGGKIIACDVSEAWTAIARRYWEVAGVSHKIDLRLAPALQTLTYLIHQGNVGTFDFVFIDADKENYHQYYELSLTLLRPGGLMAIDNVLWGGRVAEPGPQDAETEALQEFNQKLSQDHRISLSLMPIGDGLTLALKR